MSYVRIPNDIADHFGVPEFVSREELSELFPSVAVAVNGESADWSAYADLFRAYEDHRTVVHVSDNRRALVLEHYNAERTRINCINAERAIPVIG